MNTNKKVLELNNRDMQALVQHKLAQLSHTLLADFSITD